MPDIIAESTLEDFVQAHQARRPAMLWYRVINDLQTPLGIYARIKQNQRYTYILESVTQREGRGRYTIMGFDPDILWRAFRNKAEINTQPYRDPEAFVPLLVSAKQSLEQLLRESQVDTPKEIPLMASMLVGYLGYGCIGWQENIPDTNPDTLGTPDALMMRPRLIMVFDTLTDEVSVIALCYPSPDGILLGTAQALQETQQRLNASMDLLHTPINLHELHRANDAVDIAALNIPEAMEANITPAQYQQMVHQAKEYINAGDIFQVVLSQRFHMPFPLPPLSLFRTLRRSNPSPFLFLLECDQFSVIGSSPELMVRLRDGTVTIRPIAGTRPRGANPEQDQALAEELLTDPKENAEHLMLLDLGRNDVGRVSQIGTVQVTHQFFVERYSHVMHIVSNVEGKLDKRFSSLDALMAGFPAGTVSGAPKIRAMEIINELEPIRRGIYSGCVGYFAGDGNMDNCIALRTAVLHQDTLYIQAGAGIVADSDPQAEHQECVNKSRALYAAACQAIALERQRRQLPQA